MRDASVRVDVTSACTHLSINSPQPARACTHYFTQRSNAMSPFFLLPADLLSLSLPFLPPSLSSFLSIMSFPDFRRSKRFEPYRQLGSESPVSTNSVSPSGSLGRPLCSFTSSSSLLGVCLFLPQLPTNAHIFTLTLPRWTLHTMILVAQYLLASRSVHRSTSKYSSATHPYPVLSFSRPKSMGCESLTGPERTRR